MNKAQTGQELKELWRRWLMPGVTLLIFALVAAGLHRQLAQFSFSSMLGHLRAIRLRALGAAILSTALSYWLLGFYDVLALRYLGKAVP